MAPNRPETYEKHKTSNKLLEDGLHGVNHKRKTA